MYKSLKFFSAVSKIMHSFFFSFFFSNFTWDTFKTNVVHTRSFQVDLFWYIESKEKNGSLLNWRCEEIEIGWHNIVDTKIRLSRAHTHNKLAIIKYNACEPKWSVKWVKWSESNRAFLLELAADTQYAHRTHKQPQSRTDIESHQRANSSGKFAYVRSWLQKKHCKFTHSFVLYMNECNSCIYSTNNQFRTLQEPTHMQNGKKREITNAPKKHKLAHVCVCLHANLCVRIAVSLQIFSRCWDPY